MYQNKVLEITTPQPKAKSIVSVDSPLLILERGFECMSISKEF